MARILKYQIKYLEWLEKASNEEILNECLDSGGGDSWDGCFTNEGEWRYEKVKEELIKRLKQIKFLND